MNNEIEPQNSHAPENMIHDGIKVIQDYLRTLPLTPGVYRMIAQDGGVLYVGKAKSLKKRVVSYTYFNKLPHRLQRMVARTRKMEFIITHTEAEALLLEANLIKELKPRYNILLRDDKSFPYILIREDHDYPQVLKHRGAKKIKGKYFGPFAGVGDVNRTIAILQRVFLLRNCTDHYFAQRTRPCLQYHIKRCSAPCVGKVTNAEYLEQVKGARDFLDGKSREVQERFTQAMNKASTDMDYEAAASYRDRIRALSSIQTHQDINTNVGDADIIGLYQENGRSCIQVFFVRAGQNLGNRSYFPRHEADEAPQDILAAFMAQFYQNKPLPAQIIVSEIPADKALLEQVFSEKIGKKVVISKPERGTRKKLLEFVLRNAKEAYARQMAQSASQAILLDGVAKLFDMDAPPQRIEVYDNSHIAGTNMVGAMVVAGPEGFIKNAYRKFNIRSAQAADDYGMMREVLTRRFKKVLEEEGAQKDENWPDLLLIDGGLGQFNVCREVLEEMGILQDLTLVSIAKGPDRNAGREKFYMQDREEFQCPINDPVLHYLQRLRDEAHRFAIGAHRKRREMQISKTPLDEISGIGPKKKKALLSYFGSAKAVSAAGVEDLEKVEGISKEIAEKIYSFFHGS